MSQEAIAATWSRNDEGFIKAEAAKIEEGMGLGRIWVSTGSLEGEGMLMTGELPAGEIGWVDGGTSDSEVGCSAGTWESV